MKNLIIFILLTVAAIAEAATVNGYVLDRFGRARSVQVGFTSISRPTIDNPYIYPGWTVNLTTLTNGYFTTNLYQGDYKVQVGNDTLDLFYISVPSGSLTYNISQITTNSITTNTTISAWLLSTNGSAYGLRIPTGATSNYVWTCTNSTTGAGQWAASSGSGSTVTISGVLQLEDGNLFEFE